MLRAGGTEGVPAHIVMLVVQACSWHGVLACEGWAAAGSGSCGAKARFPAVTLSVHLGDGTQEASGTRIVKNDQMARSPDPLLEGRAILSAHWCCVLLRC